MDGGGIKGVVLIAQLMALEKLTQGRSILECFDWIAGTSTGGILASGLAAGENEKRKRDYQCRYQYQQS